LPFATSRIPIHPAAHVNLSIPAGSIWIAARLFSAGAPDGSFAGIRIKSGTLTISGHSNIQNDVLVVPPNEAVTLKVMLDTPATGGPATGPGAEAAQAKATLPATATFVCTAAKMQRVDTENASISLYGEALTFTRNQVDPVYDAGLRQMLVPFSRLK
jgi:hypothetical protein